MFWFVTPTFVSHTNTPPSFGATSADTAVVIGREARPHTSSHARSIQSVVRPNTVHVWP